MNIKNEVIILHISDLHRTPGAALSNDDLWGTLRNDIYNNYTDTDLGAHEPQLPKPDEISLIVVSGDITQTADPKEYTEAEVFLSKLATELLGGDKKKLILVPGNHDVRWSFSRGAYTTVDSIDYKKLKQAHARESKYRLATLEKSVKYDKDGKYCIDLFERSDEDLYKKRFEPFAEFFGRFYDKAYSFSLDNTKEQWTVFDSFTKDLGIVLVGFNSCFSIDHLWHQGAIQREAIYKASEELDRRGYQAKGGPLRIAVWHHNVLGSPQQQDFMDPQTAVLLAQHGFSLGLHGHVHQSGRFDAIGSQANLPVVWAGSMCAGVQERPPSIPFLYNVIGVNPSLRKGWVHTRSRDNENEEWCSYNKWDRKKRSWYPLNLSLTGADHNIVELQEEIKTLAKENDDFRNKLNRYVSKVYPIKRPPVHQVIDATMVYRCCNDNGDCAGTIKLTISPSGKDFVHRVNWVINADEEADSVKLDKLAITATDKNSPTTDIIWLPLKEERWSKPICLFFIPPISPGEQREIELTFEWPKFFQRLVDGIRTECMWTESVINKLYMEHVFPPKFIGITCTNETPHRPTTHFCEEVTPEGEKRVIYECSDAPDILNHTLQFTPT